jgi:hypothetical protein
MFHVKPEPPSPCFTHLGELLPCRLLYFDRTTPRILLIPRCCRRSPPTSRVTGVPPPLKNHTAPPHLRPPPWTACSDEPCYPPPCPAPPRCCPRALREHLTTKESAVWAWQPHHRLGRDRGDYAPTRVVHTPCRCSGPQWLLGQTSRPRPWAKRGPITVPRFSPFSDFLFPVEIIENLFKLLKYIENKIKITQIQNKFP